MKTMKPGLSYISMFFLLIYLSQIQVTNSMFDKVRVHITDGLTNEALNLHCKSKDDDLGTHYVPVNEEYSWEFSLNFCSTTRFTCDLWWKGGLQTFNAYDATIDVCDEVDCIWRATNDEIYLYNFLKKEYKKKYSWDPQ